jgi:hypothetical protein
MDNESNARFEKDNGKLLQMQVDVLNSHTTFMVTSAKSPFPGVDNRVYASKWAWRREENGTFVAGFTFKGTLPPPLSLAPPPPLSPCLLRLQ